MSLIYSLIVFALIYLSIVFIWFILNTLVYFFSLAFKTERIFSSFTSLGMIIYYLLSLAIGIGIFAYMIYLLLNGEFLWLLIMFFAGIGLILMFLNFLQIPFIAIPAFYLSKIEGKDFNENVVEAEILDAEGKVIGKTEGDIQTSRRLAIYFLLNYFLLFIYIYIFPSEDQKQNGFFDNIIFAFLQVLVGVLFVSIPYAIYRKLRYKKIWEDKRIFFSQVLKISIIIYLILTLFTVGVIFLFG